MKTSFGLLMILTLLAALTPPAAAYQEEERTIHRLPSGDILYPGWVLELPEHYEFLPATSLHHPQHDHPQQWEGQEWDPSMWNQYWTPEKTLKKFFKTGIFTRQYMTRGRHSRPVLEVGPTFFKLSDLDQRRCLKLLIDTSDIFNRGHDVIELRDWHTNDAVGSYTRKGMQLN